MAFLNYKRNAEEMIEKERKILKLRKVFSLNVINIYFCNSMTISKNIS